MLNKVQAYIDKHQLFSKHDHLLLGVSGGPDSVCLTHVLSELGYKHLSIAHVNHCIRGVSATNDALYVKELAEELDIPFHEIEVDTLAYTDQHKLSIEDAARQLRLQFFKQISEQWAIHKVVLAHNANDQVETMIMRFIRGSGMQGLCGIEPLKDIMGITVTRPLLSTWRTEILDYLKEKDVTCCFDASNSEPIYTRNKVRLQLIPELEKYNPNLGETLLRTAEIFAEDENYLKNETEQWLVSVIEKKKANEIRLNVKRLHELPSAMQRRVVRSSIEQVQGHLENVSLLYIDNFLMNKLSTIKLDKRGILHTSKDRL